MMKDGAILLNFSRGELVDAEALKAALASGKIKKYVTDFADERMLGEKDVIVLPHLGASPGKRGQLRGHGSQADCRLP
jgi:D-3-phosphoglycerate dehydrogenase